MGEINFGSIPYREKDLLKGETIGRLLGVYDVGTTFSKSGKKVKFVVFAIYTQEGRVVFYRLPVFLFQGSDLFNLFSELNYNPATQKFSEVLAKMPYLHVFLNDKGYVEKVQVLNDPSYEIAVPYQPFQYTIDELLELVVSEDRRIPKYIVNRVLASIEYQEIMQEALNSVEAKDQVDSDREEDKQEEFIVPDQNTLLTQAHKEQEKQNQEEDITIETVALDSQKEESDKSANEEVDIMDKINILRKKMSQKDLEAVLKNFGVRSLEDLADREDIVNMLYESYL
ncbi:MAG: hypothetical protein QXE51_00075 [Nitrososphaeria archaeon]